MKIIDKILRTKLSYAIYTVLVAFMFTSCNTDATNPLKCYLKVKEKHPNAIIFQIPNEKYKFIAVDTCGKVTYVETYDSSTPNVTAEEVVCNCN